MMPRSTKNASDSEAQGLQNSSAETPTLEARILVVDDESVVRTTYKNILTGLQSQPFSTPDSGLPPACKMYYRPARSLDEEDRSVTICENGQDAVTVMQLALKQQRPFAVAFIDVKMPQGMDGIECAEILRRLDPFIQIIIVTGFSEVSINAIVRRVPPVEKLYYMQKPFQAAEIMQFATTLTAKWRKEHEYLRIKRELEERINEHSVALQMTSSHLVREIDKRILAEEAFKRSEALKRATWEASKDALILTDALGAITALNPAAESLVGHESAELLGRPLETLFSQGVAPDFLKDLGAIEARTFEAWIKPKEGEAIPVELSLSTGEEGEQRFVMLALRDIRERLVTEERLRLLSVALESAANGVLITQANGEIIWTNPAFCRLTGYEAHEVLGKNPRFLKSDLQPERFYSQLWSTISAGAVWVGELINRRKDGVDYSEEMTITPLRNAQGAITNFIAVKSDISERKMAQVALERAKQAAESMSQAKSEFLANMSHEIRTPMNGVLGMLTFLKDTRLLTSQREYVEVALNSATALMSIIDDILDFSRIEAGKLALDPLPFDLHVALEDVLRLLQGKAQEKNLDLILHYAPDLPFRFIGDAGRIRQIITNLVGNALKFTERGYVLLHVSAEEKGTDRLHLSIRVEDTGIGIPEDQLGNIFDKFTQADTSTTRKYGGNGLGLAICRQLLALMGGTISVESRKGYGSSFTCHLNLALDPEAAVAQLPAPDLKQSRFLIVDNSRLYRRILSEQFESWGLESKSVDCGAEALYELRAAMHAEKPYHFALIDDSLNDIDFLELAKSIRQDRELASLRLILITAAGQRGDARRAKDAGFAAYFVKPVRSSNLLEALNSVNSASQDSENRSPKLVTRYSIEEDKRAQAVPQNDERQPIPAMVLLAEDNIVNQKVAVGVLTRFGCQVEVAVNGSEALDMLEKKRYDMVFMDCQMPIMDGYEATRAIRERELRHAKPHLPVIAMTAHAVQGAREECLASGMDDYVSKPLDWRILRQTVERWYPRPLQTANPTLEEKAMENKMTASTAKTVQPDVPILDREAALAIVGEDVELMETVRQAFFFDAPKQLATLKEALAATDYDAILKRAHSLKGAGANIGAKRLANAAKDLEMAMRERRYDFAQPGAAALIAAFDELERSLAG